MRRDFKCLDEEMFLVFFPTLKHSKIKESKLLLILKISCLAQNKSPRGTYQSATGPFHAANRIKTKVRFLLISQISPWKCCKQKEVAILMQKSNINSSCTHHTHTHTLIAIITKRFDVVVDNIRMHNR